MDVFMPLEEKLKKENKFIKIIKEIFKFICGIYLYNFYLRGYYLGCCVQNNEGEMYFSFPIILFYKLF